MSAASQSKPIRQAYIRYLETAKKISWRLTALLLWIIVVSRTFGLQKILGAPFDTLWSVLYDGLRGVNLAPTSFLLFRWAARIGWLVLITGFRLSALCGFVAYFLIFPFSIVLYVLFRSFLKKIRDSQPATPTPSHARTFSIPFRKLTTGALFLWFVLYSDGVYRGQLLLGAILSGCLFAMMVSRAILQTRPASASEVAYLGAFERFVSGFRKIVVDMKPPRPK